MSTAAPPSDNDRISLLRQADRLRAAAGRAPHDPDIQHDLGLTLLHLGQPAAGLRHFEAALSLAPTHKQALFRLGMARDMLGLPGAAELYGQAIRAGLNQPEVFSRLARLLHRAGSRPEAAPLYRHAASLAPGSFPALLDNALAALIEGALAEAETLFRQVLAARPETPDVRQHLAHILGARGDFGGAAAELEQALQDQPGEVGLFYDLVKNRRVTAADTALLARMQAARGQPADTPDRIKLYLALAKALDDVGDYAGAAAELDAANLLRAATSRFDAAAVAGLTDAVMRVFTPATMAHPAHRGSASRLPILVVGMPRSGTTLMEQILASHAQVAGAGEVHFWEEQGQAFVQHAQPGMGADLRAVAAAYEARLRQASATAARVVDKLPYNFRWGPLVHLAFPHARIIHCRRHAADTCLSIMSADLLATPSFSNVRHDLHVLYRDYRRMAAHAQALLPADVWMDVDYEALVADPEPVVRAVLAFCGLPWDAACLSPERSGGVVLTFSQFQARQKINAGSVFRHRRYGTWLDDFAALEDQAGLRRLADWFRAQGRPDRASGVQQRAALLFRDSAVAR